MQDFERDMLRVVEAADDTQPEVEPERRFPIQGNSSAKAREEGRVYGTVPWSIAEKAFEGYAQRFPGSARQQPLEVIAQRGGFGHGEMTTFTGSEDWRQHFVPK